MDIDDELLMITGGSNTAKKSKKRASSSDEEGAISESGSEDEKPKSPKGKGKAKRPAKKAKSSKNNDSDSEDEGFADGYDEQLMGDDEDRKYLFSLPELEREAIIAERYAKRKEAQERSEFQKSLKKGSKSSSSVDSPRRSAAPKRAPKSAGKSDKASALSDLKKRRAKATSAVVSSSEDEDDFVAKDDDVEESESEDEYRAKDDKKSSREDKTAEREKDVPDTSRTISKDDMNRIILQRVFFEKYIEEPFFDDLVVGFFVRVGIGKHGEKPVYRACQIKEVREGPRKYKLGNRTTQKEVVLKLGLSEKRFTMESISNQPATEEEFAHWLKEVNKAGLKPMTEKEAEQKARSLSIADKYHYTDEVISQMIEKKKQGKTKPQNIAAERARLLELRAVAKDHGDQDEFDRLTDKIAEMDLYLKNEQSKGDRLATINQKNIQKNVDAQSKITAHDDISVGTGTFDPFSKRRTAPAQIIFTKDALAEAAAEAKNAQPAPVVEKKEAPKDDFEIAIHQPNPEDILKNAHNIEIDSPVITKVAVKKAPVRTGAQQPKRPTLSVDDYKRRRGLL